VLGLLADPARAAQLGAQGQAWVRQHWSWDAATERLVALLRGDQPSGSGWAAPKTSTREQSC
jgi:phosphatidylinositol alpha-1,6-mannosyltransferase